MTVMMYLHAADFIAEYDPEIARSLSQVRPRDHLISESSTASRSLDLRVEYDHEIASSSRIDVGQLGKV